MKGSNKFSRILSNFIQIFYYYNIFDNFFCAIYLTEANYFFRSKVSAFEWYSMFFHNNKLIEMNLMETLNKIQGNTILIAFSKNQQNFNHTKHNFYPVYEHLLIYDQYF